MNAQNLDAHPSRRNLLIGALALPAVAIPAVVTASVQDPVVAIYNRWRALEDEQAPVELRLDDVINEMTQRNGDHWAIVGRRQAWCADPAYPEFEALSDRSDELNEAASVLLDAMAACPATSIQGIACKMLAALEVWRFLDGSNRDPEYHEEMTVAFMRDAVQVLGGSAVA